MSATVQRTWVTRPEEPAALWERVLCRWELVWEEARRSARWSFCGAEELFFEGVMALYESLEAEQDQLASEATPEDGSGEVMVMGKEGYGRPESAPGPPRRTGGACDAGAWRHRDRVRDRISLAAMRSRTPLSAPNAAVRDMTMISKGGVAAVSGVDRVAPRRETALRVATSAWHSLGAHPDQPEPADGTHEVGCGMLSETRATGIPLGGGQSGACAEAADDPGEASAGGVGADDALSAVPADRVQAAFATLDRLERQVLELQYGLWERDLGMTEREVCERLGLGRRRLQRLRNAALGKLAEALSAEVLGAMGLDGLEAA